MDSSPCFRGTEPGRTGGEALEPFGITDSTIEDAAKACSGWIRAGRLANVTNQEKEMEGYCRQIRLSNSEAVYCIYV